MDNDFATGYALGSDSNGGNCNNGGFWGGDGWWAIIIFAMIFGWGRGGFGGFGGGGASTDPGLQGLATRADVNEAIAFNGVERGISAIQQGICDSTYALNNSITSGFNNTNVALLQGFNGVQSQMCNMAAQAQDFCCQTQRAIDGVNYNMATNTCAIQNTIQGSTRDILENNNSNTRAILDFLTQSKIDSLQAENQSLKLAASQANQNRKQYIIKPYNPCGSKRFLYDISLFPPPFPPPIDLVPSNKAIPLWSVELSLWV